MSTKFNAYLSKDPQVAKRKMKKSLSNSGYNRVQISYHREDMSPLGGVHNISYVDDDDDDEKPLAM